MPTNCKRKWTEEAAEAAPRPKDEGPPGKKPETPVIRSIYGESR